MRNMGGNVSKPIRHLFTKSIVRLGLILLVLFLANEVFSQITNNDSLLTDTLSERFVKHSEGSKIIRFQKKVVEHGPDSLMYNTIILENTADTQLDGVVSLNLPFGWSCVGTEMEDGMKVSLKPGEIKRISIWMVQAKDAIGGRTYVIAGRFLINGGRKFEINSTYVKIPIKSNWNFDTPINKYYFESNYKYKTFELYFQNLGNTKELINVELKNGGNLNSRDFKSPRDEILVELGPQKDTTISFSVSSIEESDHIINQNIFLNSISIKASSGDISKTKSIRFVKLPSLGVNSTKSVNESPLNIEYFAQGGFGTRNSRLIINGDIYFNKYNKLRYSTNFSYFQGNDLQGTLWRTSNYLINYRTRNLRIDIGDVGVFSNEIASNSSRGLGISAFLPNGDVISGKITTSIFFSNQTHLGVGYSKKIRRHKISLAASQLWDGFNLKNTSNAGVKLNLALSNNSRLGLLYNFSLRNHYFGPTDFPNVEDENRTLEGHFFEINNEVAFGKLKANTVLSVSSPFYSANQNNTTQARNTLRYRINKKSSVTNTFYFINTNPYQIFQGARFYTNSFRNIIETLRYSRTINTKLTVNTQFDFSSREIRFPAINNSLKNEILSYGFGIGATYKLSTQQSISGSFSKGYFVPVSVFNSSVSSILGEPIPTTRISGEYRNRLSGISFSYTKGLFNQSVISANSDGSFSNEFFIVRPYLSKNYFDDKLNVEANLNAAIFNKFESENYSLNILGSLILPRGWRVRANTGVFINRRTFGEAESSTSRNFNLNFSIRKSFDFQQPGIKYYDLTIKFFKDDNGNGIKDDNELDLEDIIAFITYQKNNPLNDFSAFTEKELKSDKSGVVTYKYIPIGKYNVTVSPLNKYKGEITLNDLSRDFEVVGNTTLYFGFSETYKIRGKIIMNRDPNSSLGDVSLRDIPVFAIDTGGNSYKTLTDENGNFFLSVDAPGLYKVRFKDVFDNSFSIQQDEFEIDFNGIKTYQLDFVVFENKRALNVNGENDYKFKLLGGQNEEKKTPVKNETDQKEKLKTTPMPSLNSDAEEKLWEKTDDLQKQIDELRKLKEELQDIQTQQKQTLEEINQAKEEFEKVKEEAQKVQEQQQPQQTNTPINTDNSNLDELDELIDQLIEKTNPTVNYRVEFGVFKEKMPINFLNQLIKFGNVEVSDGEGGESRFISKPYYSKKEAEDYANYLKQQNIGEIRLVGEKDGKEVPVEEVDQLLNK